LAGVDEPKDLRAGFLAGLVVPWPLPLEWPLPLADERTGWIERASAASAAALFGCSQVNSFSMRPKWPFAAVCL
jgi:hypothetical protein